MNRLFLIAALLLFSINAHAATYAQVFQSLLTQQRATGAALSGGKVYFYTPGTSTLATIYTDRNMGTAAANPATLSTDGTVAVYGNGQYDVKITTSAGVQKFYWYGVSLVDASNLTGISTAFTNYTGTARLESSDARISNVYDVGKYSSMSAAVTAIGSTKATLRYSSDVSLADDLTIPSTLTLEPYNGAVITIATGKTLTVNSSLPPLAIKYFTGDGSIVLSGGVAYAEWFGTNTAPGTTDMTSAISAACNSGASNLIINGTYKTTAEIVCSNPITIYGTGTIHASTLGANKSILKFTSSGAHVRDITIYGPTSAAYVSEENGILFLGASGTHIDNCSAIGVEVYNVGSVGILAEYCDNAVIQDNYVHDVGYVGIGGYTSHGTLISGNTISTVTPGVAGECYGITNSSRLNEAQPTHFRVSDNRVTGVATWSGIDVHGGISGSIQGNTIESCLFGIAVGADSTNRPPIEIAVSGNVVKNGTVAAPGYGITVTGFNASNKAHGIVCDGNTVEGMGATNTTTAGAVNFAYTESCKLSGIIRNSLTNAVYLANDNTNILVSGIDISGITTGVANASGIQIYGTNQTGLIDGCNIDATAEYGIYIAQSSSAGFEFGRNRLISSVPGNEFVNALYGGKGIVIEASSEVNAPSIAAAASHSFTVTTAGAELGDTATVGVSSALTAGIVMSAYVSATNVTTVTLFNSTAAPIDMGAITYSARVVKQ